MIIGLLARSRCGKDTVCDYIVARHPATAEKVRLAQPIKDAVCNLYGFTHAQLEGPTKDTVDDTIGISPRDAMVSITNHVMNQLGNDFFSRRLFSSIDSGLRDKNCLVVIPDVRYAHDLHEIRRRGGIIIKIQRSSLTTPKYAWEDPIDAMQGDYSIDNNGTIDDLYDSVRDVLAMAVSQNE